MNDKRKRKAVALGDFDGMHLAHKTVVTGADDVVWRRNDTVRF